MLRLGPGSVARLVDRANGSVRPSTATYSRVQTASRKSAVVVATKPLGWVRQYSSGRPSEFEEQNPLLDTYQEEIKEEVEEDVELDEVDPRTVHEDPQLQTLSEHAGFKRTWERFHDRFMKRLSLMDHRLSEEAKIEELSRYMPPWTDHLSLDYLEPLDPEESEIYEAFDPDLKETWEDDYYRRAMNADVDLDQPGGDWGDTRMTYGISPPAKIYFRGMIDASREGDDAAVLELFNAMLNDHEIGHHEIPAGVYRLAMEAYSEFNPGEARKCFQKIAETNSLTVDDYEVMIQAYLIGAEPTLAADTYSALLHSHLKAQASLEAHKLGYVASKLSQDNFNSDRAASAITHYKGAGPSAIPPAAELSLWSLNNAYQKNDVEAALNHYKNIRETISSASKEERDGILSEGTYLAMKIFDERSQFDKVLEAYRFASSEIGEKWFTTDSAAAELAMRAFVHTNEPQEAQRMLDTFLSADEKDNVDEISVSTFGPIVEAAVLAGSQEVLDSTFARVQDLGLAEDQVDYAPLYIAAMKAKPDDVAHVLKMFQHVQFDEENADVPVEIALKALIKAERWDDAEKIWRSGLAAVQFKTVAPYIQGLKVIQRKTDLDAVTAIARSIVAGGVPITYGFARDLSLALFKALPDREVKEDITGTLFRRFKAQKFSKERPELIMPRNLQTGVLHVIEQCRAGVQELFVD